MWAAHCSSHRSVSTDLVWDQVFQTLEFYRKNKGATQKNGSIKQAILSFRGVRWDTQNLHLLCFFKKISHISARNFISNHFCSCTYFQEFVNVSLNSGKKIGSCNLTGLWDSTDYSVAIRCINDGSAFWSGWSGEKNGSTEEKGKLPTCNSFPLLHFEALGFCREKPCFSILSIYWI